MPSRKESPSLTSVQKYGRPNEATPAKWQQEYKDFNAPEANGTPAKTEGPPAHPQTETNPGEPPQAPAIAGAAASEEAAPPAPEDSEKKKRKRHEGETAEERAERKRKKKEKKEKRKSKKEGSDEEGSE